MGANARVVGAFFRARVRGRWGAARIEAHQLAGLRHLTGLADAGSVEEALARLPVITPREFTIRFAELNVLGVSLEAARTIAREEMETGTVRQPGYSFGLSTGTMGDPGVFITSEAERQTWLGTILGRYFTLRDLASSPRPLRVALLLKYNSRLYSDASSGRIIRLCYVDITTPRAAWEASLRAFAPHVMIGPPSILAEMAATDTPPADSAQPPLRPRLVIAGAEPLLPHDRSAIERGFGVAPRGIYQAREGFLASGCSHGRLHLNEDLVAFEVMPLSYDRSRGALVITDFTRTSQSYRRYRMDDLVRRHDTPCACGSRFTSIDVEGRLQDVLYRLDGTPAFPSELDAVIGRHVPRHPDVVLSQQAIATFTLAADGAAPTALVTELETMLAGTSSARPVVTVVPRTAQPPGEKRRPFQRWFDNDSEALVAQFSPPERLGTQQP